ncbi:hypothetical protein An09g06425 [Aspergillus niger]|uniref:Uncharacterized protein n=2 Tax=Aspergillus niger TaxID=5061 RepID=A2QUQ5_ASPNC|nr:hypothetical protein An09g06425 [Aspergillus niger]CAK40435.1 hypothetical protein An09g06425 [Aspergillus niger]
MIVSPDDRGQPIPGAPVAVQVLSIVCLRFRKGAVSTVPCTGGSYSVPPRLTVTTGFFRTKVHAPLLFSHLLFPIDRLQSPLFIVRSFSLHFALLQSFQPRLSFFPSFHCFIYLVCLDRLVINHCQRYFLSQDRDSESDCV